MITILSMAKSFAGKKYTLSDLCENRLLWGKFNKINTKMATSRKLA